MRKPILSVGGLFGAVLVLLVAGCESNPDARANARTAFDGEPIVCTPVPAWLAGALELGVKVGTEDLVAPARGQDPADTTK